MALHFEERRTFLHFHEDSVSPGTASRRPRSADSGPSSASSSEASRSAGLSANGLEGSTARHKQIEQFRKRLQEKSLRGRTRYSSSDESAGEEPVIVPHLRQAGNNDLMTDKHLVWDSSSNTESIMSSVGLDENSDLSRRPEASKGPSNHSNLEKPPRKSRGQEKSSAPKGEKPRAPRKLPSLGSAKHATNHCRPCHFHFSKEGCKSGEQCPFCHFRHSKRGTDDIPKDQQQLCKSLVKLVYEGTVGTPQKAEAEVQLLSWIGQESRIGAYALKSVRCHAGDAACKEDFSRFLADVAKQLQGWQAPLQDGEDSNDADTPGNPASSNSASADVTRQECPDDCRVTRVSL